MKLLEYEAKMILESFAIPTPKHVLIDVKQEYIPLGIVFPCVLKSQVPVGGRGKLGGVISVHDESEIAQAISALSSLSIKGFLPKKLLVEEKLTIKHEHYLALLIDRSSATIRLIAHKAGGVEVEDNTSDEFLNLPITSNTVASSGRKLATYLGYDPIVTEPLVKNLYKAFVSSDSTLLEINPLIYTSDNLLICGDCKMELDDSAAFRHKQWKFETQDSNFVVLDKKGTVATIANGAGLAMATVDEVQAQGMSAANFLDVGGGATAETVLQAFKRIMTLGAVSYILINIFAGITRCDEVARAIIEARRAVPSLPPLYIRLAGTNAKEANKLLLDAHITTFPTLDACLKAISGDMK